MSGLFRVTVRRVVFAWGVLLCVAGLILPNSNLHFRLRRFDAYLLGAMCVTLLVLSPIALIRYFNQAWRRVREVPNRSAYVAWLGLESLAATALLAGLLYEAVLTLGAR
jgi:hypothetical protein